MWKVVTGCLAAAMAAAVAVLASLAANAATADGQWPYHLDAIRRDPWPWVVGLGAVAVLLAVVAVLPVGEPAAGDAPPSPPPVPPWVVGRAEGRRAVAAVCVRRRRGPHTRTVGITTSLQGAGGFGKTTLATVVRAHPRVRRHFRGRIYMFTIGRDVRSRADIAAKVAEVTAFITGDTRTFEDADTAGDHLGRLLDARPRTLLVLDDVWDREQLDPFLRGGRTCVRLVTTRVPGILPEDTAQVRVDEMPPEQAHEVLTWELPALPAPTVAGLLEATGRWALLLRLTNRLIARRVATGADAAAAAARVLERLRQDGPAAGEGPARPLDLDDPARRARAVRASIEAATTRLPPGGARRFAELAVFCEDEAVPVSLIARLWETTGGLTEAGTRDLCAELDRLSLVTVRADGGGRLTLHDVLRDYLRDELGDTELARLHGILLDGALPDPWWELTDGYLLDHLIEHLAGAGRPERAEEIAGDLRWVEMRLHRRGPAAPAADLARLRTATAAALARDLTRAAHLLTPAGPPATLTGILHSRLGQLPHWDAQTAARQAGGSPRPLLANRWPLPDLPHPALLRTISGHRGSVERVAIAPDGGWLATTESGGALRRWDPRTGNRLAEPGRRRRVSTALAVAPDGRRLLAESGSSLAEHDVVTGRPLGNVHGSGAALDAAYGPDGTWFVAVGLSGEVKRWETASRLRTHTFHGHTGHVRAVAVAPGGDWFATAGDDHTVRLWNPGSGECTVLRGHRDRVLAVAVAPDGTWLVSADAAGTVWEWDLATRSGTGFGAHLGAVLAVAVAPDGSWYATGGQDRTVRLHEMGTDAGATTLTGHADQVRALAVAPGGDWLASAGADRTVRLWETADRDEQPLAHRHGQVASLAVSPDGTRLVTAGGDFGLLLWRLGGEVEGGDGGGAGADAGAGVVEAIPADPWLQAGRVLWTPDGSRVVVLADATVSIWDASLQSCVTTLGGHPGDAGGTASRTADDTGAATATVAGIGAGSAGGTVFEIAVAPDGSRVATGHGRTVRLWDLATGAPLPAELATDGRVRHLAFAPDASWLAAAGGKGVIRIWDPAAGAVTATLSGHHGPVHAVAVAPDGTWLASAADDGRVRIWDTLTWTCVAVLDGHEGAVNTLAVTPCGRWIASGGEDGSVRVWERAGLRTVAAVRTEGAVRSCDWTPDGGGLAVGGDRGVYVYDFHA